MPQIADDPGRQISAPWLGPHNSWRWPVDWTYKQWALAGASFVIGGTLLTWVLPCGAVAAGLAWAAARKTSQVLAPESPRRWFRTVLGGLLLFLALLLPDPSVWLEPLWMPLALLVSPVIPWWTVRTFGRYVDWNRPIAWWLQLPGQVARGPRESGGGEIDVSGLALLGLSHETSQEPVIEQPKPVLSSGTDLVLRSTKTDIAVREPKRPWIERTPTGFRVGNTYYVWT